MRKLVFVLLCILLFWCTYNTIAVGFNVGNKVSINGYKEISEKSRKIDTLISQLINVNEEEFKKSNDSLKQAITKYNNTKEEYEELAQTLNTSESAPDISLVDIYDIDFLWTIIGNYGTEEGISLKFFVTNSPGSFLNNSAYTVCDLKFTVSGNYIPITDFIYDLEDDNRLGFEITDFELIKGGENLQATFTVKNVPISTKNLSEIPTYVTSNDNSKFDEYGNPVNSGSEGSKSESSTSEKNSSSNGSSSGTNNENPNAPIKDTDKTEN